MTKPSNLNRVCLHGFSSRGPTLPRKNQHKNFSTSIFNLWYFCEIFCILPFSWLTISVNFPLALQDASNKISWTPSRLGDFSLRSEEKLEYLKSIKNLEIMTQELRHLSRNLWWTWNPEAQEIFAELSPLTWASSNHNSVTVLNSLSHQELKARLMEKEFAARVSDVLVEFREYLTRERTWCSAHAAPFLKNPVAYFSAEFALHESLAIYSGGLGVLAGDHAKSASDLGVPFIGISLFYRQGYFSKLIAPAACFEHQAGGLSYERGSFCLSDVRVVAGTIVREQIAEAGRGVGARSLCFHHPYSRAGRA